MSSGYLIDAYAHGAADAPADATPRTTLLGQLRTALAIIAMAVLSEDAATPYHTQRAAYAARVIRDPATEAPLFVVPVLTNNGEALWAYISIGTVLADSDIRNNVSAVWNALAGVITQ